ncbi:MAG: HNH endonuclease, partial [Burkholderiaceae bacterium]
AKFIRRNIFARDGSRCQYCGKRFPTSELSIDHVVPRSQGGKTTWTNVVTACRGCNHRKGNRTPEQARMPLLYVPYVPSLWDDFILRNRRILSDQMQFLSAHLPKGSRLLA